MLSDFNKAMLPLLRALIAGPVSSRDADALIRLAIRRTEQLLYWNNKRRNFRMQATSLSLTDLAYDMTAELFIEGEDSLCGPLRASLLPYSDATDSDLLSVLDAILFRTIQNQSPRIFAEVNPDYHQLVRSLRQHANPREDITTLDMLDGRWYLFGGMEAAMLELPAMPFEELRRSLGTVDRQHRSIAIEIFRLIEEVLCGQDVYRRAVPETEVIHLARDFVGRGFEAAFAWSEPEASIAHDVAVLSHTIQRAIESVRQSLERFYIERNRLTRTEFELILHAIKTYFLETAQGGEPRSSYAQLRSCMPGLTPERFQESYRRKYIYIHELVSTEARRLLQAESDPQTGVVRFQAGITGHETGAINPQAGVTGLQTGVTGSETGAIIPQAEVGSPQHKKK